VMDPWYPLGSHDMLEVAGMGLHVGQMTGVDEIKACFTAITEAPAKIMGLENYGLRVGANADLVVLQAADPFEAIRLRPERLYVIRRGQIIASAPKRETLVQIGETPKFIDFTREGLTQL